MHSPSASVDFETVDYDFFVFCFVPSYSVVPSYNAKQYLLQKEYNKKLLCTQVKLKLRPQNCR